LFVAQGPNIQQLIESTAIGLGYELVDLELGPRGRLLRIFIDRPIDEAGAAAGRVTLDDCQRMTRQVQRVLEVEGVEYDRLEVSSPGLDRVLKKPTDFRRFTGAIAEVRLRVPLEGRRRFVGVVGAASDAAVDLEVEGATLSLAYVNIERARLVPDLIKRPTAPSSSGKARGKLSPRAVKTP
jgi:ribosome maturation factor RimP